MPGLDQLADDLLDEERVARRALVDRLLEPVERRVLADEVAQQLVRVRWLQRLQRERGVDRRAVPLVRELGPEVDHGEGARPFHRGDQLGQHRVARLVHPVQVLDHQHHRVATVGGVDQAADDPAQRPCPRLRAHLRHRAVGVGDAEEVEDQRQLLDQLRIEQQRASGDLLAGDALRVAIADAEVGAQHLQDRHQWDRAPMGLRLCLEDLEPPLAAAPGELVADAALADPRLGDDPDHSAFACFRASQCLPQHRHLAVAADEA